MGDGSMTEEIELYVVLAAALVLSISILAYVMMAGPSKEDADKAEKEEEEQLKATLKEATKKKTETSKPAATKGGSLLDIEDLKPMKSLIPETVREMKANGVTPYTQEEREDLLAELNQCGDFPKFATKLHESGSNLKRTNTVVLQANIGLYCNQACTHCHVDSSPKRKEMMSKEVTDKCIEIIKNSPTIKVVDLTGGAPELNREFRHWVTECRALGLEVIDRCNLTVLLEPTQSDLVEFLAANQVHIIASLPCYLEDNVDKQRGNSVFQRSIKALRMLNRAGYGQGTGLKLDLVYNPTGIHLPPPQEKLKPAYEKYLQENYGIHFDNLHCITNIPINRFYDFLKSEDKVVEYMEILVNSFNPHNCDKVMCRDYLSIKWDGQIFDCDFNQQVDLIPKSADKQPITVFDVECSDDLLKVPIATSLHCFGCTAGAGSA